MSDERCAGLTVGNQTYAAAATSLTSGGDPETGEFRHPSLELVRPTLPRHVYTARHLAAVADTVGTVHEHRDETVGLEMIEEPECLRFFQGRFRPLEDSA